jgi:hypothetical protein
MKIIRSVDRTDAQKVNKLIELEPDLTAIVELHKSQQAANKITRGIWRGLLVLVSVLFIAGMTLHYLGYPTP